VREGERRIKGKEDGEEEKTYSCGGGDCGGDCGGVGRDAGTGA